MAGGVVTFHELNSVRLNLRAGKVLTLGSLVFVPLRIAGWRDVGGAADFLPLEAAFETFYSVMEVRFEAK